MADKVALRIIYGIPAVGKSTLAVDIAYQQQIRTVIHTDYIREILRIFITPQHSPALAKVTHNAWEIYGAPTPENIVTGFIAHAREVSFGIKAVVAKLVIDGFDAVIEGAHFHGAIVEALRSENVNADIDATLLVVNTVTELVDRINRKESERAASASPKLWTANIQALFAIQDFLIADARAHQVRIVTADQWRAA